MSALCGHPGCTRKGCVTSCSVRQSAEYHKGLRARGFPEWTYYSSEAYARRLASVRRYERTHPEVKQRKNQRYRAKCKKLFGGRPDQDFSAREKWMTWRTERKRLRVEKQIEARKAYRLNSDPRTFKRKLEEGLFALEG